MGGQATGSAERELRFELPSRPESVAAARHAVGDFASSRGVDDADIRLALERSTEANSAS